jgi:hypothetical protein
MAAGRIGCLSLEQEGKQDTGIAVSESFAMLRKALGSPSFAGGHITGRNYLFPRRRSGSGAIQFNGSAVRSPLGPRLDRRGTWDHDDDIQ